MVMRGSEVLLIKRGKPPREGEWSLPGGGVELGERLEDAALREIYEETGVTAELGPLVDVVDYIETTTDQQTEFHYVLVDYLAYHVSGEASASSDAADARFFPIDEALALPLWQETKRVIEKAFKLAQTERETDPNDA